MKKKRKRAKLGISMWHKFSLNFSFWAKSVGADNDKGSANAKLSG